MQFKYFKAFCLLMVGVILASGCKQYDNPPPVFEELDNKEIVQRKVLIISIDGVTGSELKTIAPPVIEELKKTSKYSYDVLRGSVSNDAASWASMLTGTSYSKHLIRNDDFLPIPKENSHETPPAYRNVVDYVLQYKSVKTAVVSPWASLRAYLKQADINPEVNTDVAVKDSVINILNTQAGIGTLIVNFRDVMTAGANGGFVAANDNYKNAILKTDEYVGNIMTALKARKSFDNEDWLIIVTSNHGGSNDDTRPGFLITSHKNLQAEEIKKSGFNTILFTGSSIFAEVPDDNGLYDPGATNDFTVQVQVKFIGTISGPGFLSKGTPTLTPGGWLCRQGTANALVVIGAPGPPIAARVEDRLNPNVGSIFDWHTYTFTVKTVNATTRTITTYSDGVQVATRNIFGRGDLTTSEKLRLGYQPTALGSNGATFYAADLCYFNTALDAATILANKDLKDITQHPYYSNLVGYWPVNEGAEAVIGNKAPGGYDMMLNGPFVWTSLGTDVPPSVTPDPNVGGRSIIVTPSSVAALTLYWMNIDILPEFGIDGNPFLNQFEIELIK